MVGVKFDFDLEDKVKTKFEDVGFVEMMAIDAGGKKYFVQSKISEDGRWLRADEFELIK